MTEDDFDKLPQKIQGHERSLSDQSKQIAQLQRKVAELSIAMEALQAKFKASFLDCIGSMQPPLFQTRCSSIQCVA
jgi:uncharacterized coiled-coil protein SlyX